MTFYHDVKNEKCTAIDHNEKKINTSIESIILQLNRAIFHFYNFNTAYLLPAFEFFCFKKRKKKFWLRASYPHTACHFSFYDMNRRSFEATNVQVNCLKLTQKTFFDLLNVDVAFLQCLATLELFLPWLIVSYFSLFGSSKKSFNKKMSVQNELLKLN